MNGQSGPYTGDESFASCLPEYSGRLQQWNPFRPHFSLNEEERSRAEFQRYRVKERYGTSDLANRVGREYIA